jgi:hypothetical protein
MTRASALPQWLCSKLNQHIDFMNGKIGKKHIYKKCTILHEGLNGVQHIRENPILKNR